MSVPSVGSPSGQTGVGTTEPNGSDSITGPNGPGKQDFLMLLVAQLKNQDPLSPMDNTQFIAQLAQFNTLEQMQQMNQTLSAMADLSMLSQASSFIGKEVTAFDQATQTRIQGAVSDVTIKDGVPSLTVDGKSVGLKDVVSVSG